MKSYNIAMESADLRLVVPIETLLADSVRAMADVLGRPVFLTIYTPHGTRWVTQYPRTLDHQRPYNERVHGDGK